MFVKYDGNPISIVKIKISKINDSKNIKLFFLDLPLKTKNKVLPTKISINGNIGK